MLPVDPLTAVLVFLAIFVLFSIFRTVPQANVGVVTVFHLRYFTRTGDTLQIPVPSSELSEVFTVELTLEVQNPSAPYRDQSMVQDGQRNALYSTSLWQQTRLASQNNRR